MSNIKYAISIESRIRKTKAKLVVAKKKERKAWQHLNYCLGNRVLRDNARVKWGQSSNDLYRLGERLRAERRAAKRRLPKNIEPLLTFAQYYGL